MFEIMSDQYGDWHKPSPFLCILNSNQITCYPLLQTDIWSEDGGDILTVSNGDINQ
jgi:hypothetical protein